MTIQFKNTVNDLMHFQVHMLRKRYLKLWILLVAVIFGFHVLSSHSVHDVPFLVIDLILLVMIGLELPASMLYPRRTIFFNIAVILLVLLFFSLIHLDFSSQVHFLTLLIPLFFCGFYGIFARQMYSGKSDMIGLHTLTIDSYGVEESTDNSQTKFTWDAVTEIEDSKNYIYILIGKLKGHAIPKDSFTSTGEVNSFYQTACTLKQNDGE